jgi:hypothetical protein
MGKPHCIGSSSHSRSEHLVVQNRGRRQAGAQLAVKKSRSPDGDDSPPTKRSGGILLGTDARGKPLSRLQRNGEWWAVFDVEWKRLWLAVFGLPVKSQSEDMNLD